MTPNTIRNRFNSVLKDAENIISNYVKNPGSDMTRHRKCTLLDTITATLSFSMNRTNTELLLFFGSQNKAIPSKSAFTQQRKKFTPDFFPYLLEAFNKAIPFTKTFKGYHLVAVDGSDLNLPTNKKDTVYQIKQARSDNYFYQMHVNALFDICENRYITAITQPRPVMNETRALCHMIEQCSLPDNTIVIADRGYLSLNTIAHLLDSNLFFLIRAKSPTSGLLKYLMESNKEADTYISLGITRSRKKIYRHNPSEYKSLKPSNVFDPIPVGDRQSIYTMNIRCTCVKLGEDSYEYLVSNLPMDVFSKEDLRELYWKRWSIETSFRRLKYALSLVYLHSVNRELIIQEVYAKMIMFNFASLIHTYGAQTKILLEKKKQKQQLKYEYQVSFDDAVPVARELLKRRIKNDIIKTLLLSHLTAIKTTKPSARRVRSQTVKPLNNRA